MRQIIAAAIVLLMLLFLPPWLRAEENTPETDAALQPLQTEQPNPASGAGSDAAHTVRLWDGSAVQTLTAAEYLPGVVRGEMPATFEEEALKAQAAAERTYLYYRMTAAPKDSHPDADVCTDPGCCTAWLSEADARAKWGGKFDQYEAKVQQAVADTDGMAVCYEGVPIQALFHAASAAFTRSAAEVFGEELPYLQSVESPEGDEVPNYYSVVTVPSTEFVEKLTAAAPGCDFSGDSSGWIGPTVYDAAGLSTAPCAAAAARVSTQPIAIPESASPSGSAAKETPGST